jgi:hypothetical protein
MTSGRHLIWLAALACSGCQPGTSASVKTPEITATAELNNVLHPEWGDIVRGRLVIAGTSRKLASADIRCFYLLIGSNRSEEIRVDSYVNTARGDYPATAGKVSVDVYWPMQNFKNGTDADLAKATLEMKPDVTGSCYKFEP